jgi:hypothetical protein
LRRGTLRIRDPLLVIESRRTHCFTLAQDSQLTLPVVMSCIAAAIFSCLASTSCLMIGLRLVRLAAVNRALASATFCTSG